jgi:outer membrane receptor protein involved in Fe transport
MPRDMSEDELSKFEQINEATGLPRSTFWSTNVNADNPYWYVNRTSVNEKRNRISGLGSVSYQFTPWMNFMTRVSFDTYDERTDGSFYDGTKSNGNVLAGGQYFLTESKYTNHNLDFLLTGNTDIKNENFQLSYVLGSSLLTRSFNTYTNSANGLTVPNNFSIAFATTPAFTGISSYKRELNSVYGSFNLAMWESLYLDITGRNDWSSTLPSPHSYFYPSMGLSFVMNRLLKLPSWIDMAKVRSSFTKVGNDAEPNLLDQTYSYTPAAGTGFITRNTTKAISNLKPEQTESYELGFDFMFFKNRISLNGTYYHSNSRNQLMFLALPTVSGYSNQYINAGNIQNKGFELQLQGSPIKKTNFSWQSSFNFARNISKVVSLTDQISSVNITDNIAYGTVVVSTGGAYGDLYGYKWKVNENTGKYVVNANGLPVVEAGKKIGNFNPSATVGWVNTVKYKNWGAQINIDGRIGGEMISGTAALMADYGVAEFTEKYREGGWVLDAVDESGKPNQKAISSEAFWTAVGAGGIYPYGEFFTFDMTNFRVRNVALTYSLPNNLIRYVKAAQFSLSVNNVMFLYKGKSILEVPGLGKIKNPVDPETSIGSGNFQGIEAATLPLTRTISLGVKLSF